MADEARLSELLLRWEEGQETGRALPAKELCRDCPELLDELQRRIAALQAMDAVLGSRLPTADCR